MKKIIFGTIFLLFFTSFLSLDAQWVRTYQNSVSDKVFSIEQTSDGGYIAAGVTIPSGSVHYDVWVLKLFPSGEIEWQRNYGGSEDDIDQSIQQTSDGGYIVAGMTMSFGSQGRAIWVLKLFPSGEIEWQRIYDRSNDDIAYSIQQTSDGGFVIAGSTWTWHAPYSGSDDIWILKLSQNGTVEWQRTYEKGRGQQIAYSIQQTSDGGYIVAGSTGYKDVLILKLFPSGDIDWQSEYFGGGYGQGVRYIQQTSDGGYVVVGHVVASHFGPKYVLVIKLFSNGDIDWQKSYDSPVALYGGGSDLAYSVQQTDDGGYIVSGQESHIQGEYNIWVLKLFPNGEIEWQYSYHAYEERVHEKAHSIQQTSDGGYIVAGCGSPYGGGFSWSSIVLKLSPSGDINPSCGNLIEIPPVIVSDTNIAPYYTNIIQESTYIIPQDTNITPQDTYAAVINSCQATLPNPFISSLSTYSSTVGTEVIISGSNFGATQGSVTFNGVTASITYWTDTEVSTLVPSGATSGPIVIHIADGRDSNGVVFTVVIPDPIISSLSSNSGSVGTEVTISGSNFGSEQGTGTFNGVEAPITSWSNTEIVATVPSGATTGPVVVHTSEGKDSNGLTFTVTPPPNQPPIANFTYFLTYSPDYSTEYISTGERISFDASQSNDPDGHIISYKWDFGDGFSAESAIFDKYDYSYYKGGTYIVRLSITDDEGAVGIKEESIPIELLPWFISSSEHLRLEYANLSEQKMDELYRLIKQVLNLEQAKLEREGKNEDELFNYMNILLRQLDPEQQEQNLQKVDLIREGLLSETEEFWIDVAGGVVGLLLAPLTGAPFGATEIPGVVLAEATQMLGIEWGTQIELGEMGMVTVINPEKGRMEITYLPENNRILVNVFLEDPVNQNVFIFIPIEFEPLRNLWGGYICSPMWCGVTCPPEAAVKEPVPILDDVWINIANLQSPGELRIYDPEGNVTGLINGEIKEEIQDSQYVEGTIVLFSQIENCRYEVKGTEDGLYKLGVTLIDYGKENVFSAVDIPISVNDVHEYTFDWDALSQGEEGGTVRIDIDGDGTFDFTITTGSTFALVAATLVIEKAKIDFKKKPDDDKIHVKGRFELDLDKSDGVDISEEVTVTIGPFIETIKMTAKGKGDKWEYKRPKGKSGGIKDMKIDWKKYPEAKFDIHIDKADLGEMSDWPNPLTISIQIGDDWDYETITMKEHKHHWDYH